MSDLAGLYASLKRKGARFRNEIVEGQGGKQVLLLDPSGNLIELFEPKEAAPAANKPVFRGIFLTSAKPEDTAAFYREIALIELEQIGSVPDYVYWKSARNGIQLAIHDAGKFADYTSPPNAESNLTHLYFRIASREQFLAHLKSKDVEPYALDDIVITVSDPDGRKVMFGTA